MPVPVPLVAIQRASGFVNVGRKQSRLGAPSGCVFCARRRLCRIVGSLRRSATNLILEGKGFRPPLLTNAGFKYVLEIGRQDIPRRSSLFAWVKPKRPVPPQAIFEIGDRIGADGSEIEPLDEAAVIDDARAIAAADIRTAGIVFLHSYTNPAHERHGCCRMHSCRCRARCCRSSANTNAA